MKALYCDFHKDLEKHKYYKDDLGIYRWSDTDKKVNMLSHHEVDLSPKRRKQYERRTRVVTNIFSLLQK